MQRIGDVYLPVQGTVGLMVCAVLTACGGGGGGAPVVPGQGQAPSGSNAAFVAEDTKAFSLLNGERAQCGFGALTRNANLDAAAKAHADYQAFYGIVDHTEDKVSMPVGFTGTLPSDRVIAKGYASRLADIGPVADEITALIGTSNTDGLGESGIRSLLNAPYHLRGLMSGYRDVGMAVRSSNDVGVSKASAYLQINAAYLRSAGEQPFPVTEVRTYPCEGSTGVNYQLTNESPNPVPNRDLAVNPLGTSVLVAVRPGNILAITRSTLTDVRTGQQVATRSPVGGSNDPVNPNGRCSEGCFTNSEAYIAADAPLMPDAAYRVDVAGTNNGVPFSKQFTFTTGRGG